jgi:uncharacterized membrane protein (DUF106 family)
MDNKAQGNQLLMLLLFMVIILFIMPAIGPTLGVWFGYVLEPVIGFEGSFPILTLFFSGLIVVTLSSLLTNFFTDWKKMAQSQEAGRAFQKEISEARKTGNTNRLNKLMKMQPEIMKKQTEASSGMMKPMLFLIIFIWPIFMWLRGFLGGLDYYYFTVPWADGVSFFSRPLLFQAWLWLYLIFSMIFGQLIRQSLKVVSLSDWWKDKKPKIIPSLRS